MTISGESQPDYQEKIEAYLGKLRAQLNGIEDEEVRDIIDELRSHIMEKAAFAGGTRGEVTVSGVDAALAGLGSAEELARQYLTDNLLARAEVSWSPVQILKSLFGWASLSLAGFFVLLGAIAGYFFGVVLMLVAVAKILHPHSAGLFILPHRDGDFEMSFRLGFGSVPAGGRDLLGWWIVPVGWLGGGTLVMLTTWMAVWVARQCRKTRTRL